MVGFEQSEHMCERLHRITLATTILLPQIFSKKVGVLGILEYIEAKQAQPAF